MNRFTLSDGVQMRRGNDPFFDQPLVFDMKRGPALFTARAAAPAFGLF